MRHCDLFGTVGGQPCSVTGQTYAQDFGAQKLMKNMEIMNMPESHLIPAWERCVQSALRAKVAVEDELTKGIRANASVEFSFSRSSMNIVFFLGCRWII